MTAMVGLGEVIDLQAKMVNADTSFMLWRSCF
jgi:hypothetical protein